MTAPSLTLVVVIGALVAVGVYLMLERSLTRIVVGVVLAGNGVNLLLLSSGGAAGGPPIIGRSPVADMADPLPQAMVLTAIVITLGVSSFLLAMAYRSWQLARHDEVQDDLEDRRVARRAAQDRLAYADADADTDRTSLDDSAAEVRDETSAAEPSAEASAEPSAEASAEPSTEPSTEPSITEHPTTPGVVGAESPDDVAHQPHGPEGGHP